MTSRPTAAAVGWREVVAVFAGGMLGTGIRFTIDALLPHTDSGFPLGTLLVNVVGSFALGCLVATLWARPTTPTWLKAGLGVGTLGSFTTFSAVMVSLVAQTAAGDWMLAAGYLLATVLLGLAAAVLGLAFGRRAEPIGLRVEPFGRRAQPFGRRAQPFGPPAEPDWVDE